MHFFVFGSFFEWGVDMIGYWGKNDRGLGDCLWLLHLQLSQLRVLFRQEPKSSLPRYF